MMDPTLWFRLSSIWHMAIPCRTPTSGSQPPGGAAALLHDGETRATLLHSQIPAVAQDRDIEATESRTTRGQFILY